MGHFATSTSDIGNHSTTQVDQATKEAKRPKITDRIRREVQIGIRAHGQVMTNALCNELGPKLSNLVGNSLSIPDLCLACI
jgi:hypothetical protein